MPGPPIRIPWEAADVAEESDPGYHLPYTLDFHKVLDEHEKGSDSYNKLVNDYANLVGDELYKLSTQDTVGENTWKFEMERNGIKVETMPVAGAPSDENGPSIDMIRHSFILPFKADDVFDLYGKITYTDIIDKFTFLVDSREQFDGEDWKWLQMNITVDYLFPLMAIRDFSTLDGCDAKRRMYISKSAEHPLIPRTPVPSACCQFTRDPNANTYRSPLFWCVLVEEEGENSCKLTQIQYSDMGGIISCKELRRQVIKFGTDNMPKIQRLMELAHKSNCDFGPEDKNFLANPLLPVWKQPVKEMVPKIKGWKDY